MTRASLLQREIWRAASASNEKKENGRRERQKGREPPDTGGSPQSKAYY